MSIDLSARVTTDVVHSSNNVKAVVAPPATSSPTVSLVGSGRQNEPVNGNTLPAVVTEEVNAVAQTSPLSEAVSRMSDHVQNIRRGLEFTVDEESDRTVITVYDAESEEVIRQIPSEEFLNLVHRMNAEGGGALLNEEA